MGCPRHSLLCVTTFFKVTRPALQWILRPPLLSPIGAPTSPAAPVRRLWQWLMPAGVLGVPHLPVGGPSRRSRPRQVVSIALLFKCFLFRSSLSTGAVCEPRRGFAAQPSISRRSKGVGESLLHPVPAASRGSGPRSFSRLFCSRGALPSAPCWFRGCSPHCFGPCRLLLCSLVLCCLEATPKLSLASRLLSLCYAFALLNPHAPSCGESTRSPW